MNAPASAAEAAAMLSQRMAGRQLGRYEVLTQLASGGMASVYIARAQGVAGFERLVAIKVLHPHLAYEQEFISMFLDEARIAARIRHMNVVPTLDVSDSPGNGYFIVMEYIEGDHLGSLLGLAAKRGERLPQPFVCRVLIDALLGLAAAHRLADEDGTPLKLVHRDVSPHNVLVGTDGITRLTDFGVAKADVRIASTRAGQFKGKLSYMAPEQASSGATDQRSDLFSVGIILWESLTGRRLFKGESNAATLNKLLNDTILRPSELSPDLERFDALVMKALSRDPEKRFQNAEEFGEALDRAAARDGLYKTRDVAQLVRALDAEKLQAEQVRVRESIELLGRAEIALSKVPMPREDPSSQSQTYHRAGTTGSYLHGSAPVAPHEHPPVVGPTPSAANALRWVVMALAILVFLYAGFLVWQLSAAPAGPAPAPAPLEPDATAKHPAPVQAPERAADGPMQAEDATRGADQPEQLRSVPERTDSIESTRSRWRRHRSRAASKSAEERAKPHGKREGHPAPTRIPELDGVDVDIQNPYRN